MPQFDSPFQEERRASPGEVAQAWASFAQMGLRLLRIELNEHERDALATVIGAVLRAYPALKEIGK